MPIRWLFAIIRSQQADRFHADNRITATRLLTCPREVAIQDNLPWIMDPVSHNKPTWGTAIHEYAARFAGPEETAEYRFPETVMGVEKKPPIVCGVGISGKTDFIESEGAMIVSLDDLKCHAESKQKMVLKDGKESANVRAQVSIYKLALERSRPGLSVRSAKIWHGAMTSDGGKWFRKRWGKCPKCHSKVQVTVEEEAPPPWIDYPVPFMSEIEIMAMKPNGGDYTVAEIVEEYRLFTERLGNGESKEDAVQKIPLVGRAMFNGKKCTKYCSVLSECNSLEGIVTI